METTEKFQTIISDTSDIEKSEKKLKQENDLLNIIVRKEKN